MTKQYKKESFKITVLINLKHFIFLYFNHSLIQKFNIPFFTLLFILLPKKHLDKLHICFFSLFIFNIGNSMF